MDFIMLLMAVLFVAFTAFQTGQWSKEYPSEEEMIRRLKELRYQRKLKAEADAEVEAILKD